MQPTITDQSAANFLFIPMAYVVSGIPAANAQVIIPLLLDQDADFELHEIFGSSSADAVGDVRPANFTFQISDKSNGRNWSDNPIPQVVISKIPDGMLIKRPVLLQRRSNMSITFNNLTAGPITCTVVLIGAKVLQYNA